MEIKQYAPVIIPTLNRYNHFKRCLESLERCTGADKTDVYVGLDYPPSEKYVEGWKKIDEYLKEKEKSNGFKNLFVRRRDHNCGVGKKGSNGSLLHQEIELHYDRYISSEDDNEFSPNFLEYVNWGLEKYKDDNCVYAISGFLFPEMEGDVKGDCFLSPFSNAWGTGYWVSRRMDYIQKGSECYVNEILYSWKKSSKLYFKRTASLNGLLSMYFRKQYYGDVLKTSEMLLSGKFSLFPTVSKVRNWGHDGSGVHCDTTDRYINQAIDENSFFECVDPIKVLSVAKGVDFGWIKKVAVAIRYAGFRLTGKDFMAAYWKGKK